VGKPALALNDLVGVRFRASDVGGEARVAATKGRKPRLVPERIEQIRKLRAGGTTVPDIIRQTGLSKASVYRALAGSSH
jgi:DNA invertase Pin-like site-specific DNA recombinase